MESLSTWLREEPELAVAAGCAALNVLVVLVTLAYVLRALLYGG